MTPHATRTLLLIPILVLAPLALAHCGGSDAGVDAGAGKKPDASIVPEIDGAVETGDDAAAPESDGGITSPTGDSGSPGGDAGPPTPTPIPVPEAGAPSDPGSVVCNGAPCAVKMGYSCCATDSADAGSQEVCNPPNTACTGRKTECNEASDCNGGVCCQAIGGIALVGSATCSATDKCAGQSITSFQTCRTDAECGQASDAGALKRCIPQLCTNANPMRTLKIEACAVPPSGFNGDAGTLAYCAPLE